MIKDRTSTANAPPAGGDNGDRPEGKTSRKTSTHQEVLPETYQSGYHDERGNNRKRGHHTTTRRAGPYGMVSERDILYHGYDQPYGPSHIEYHRGLADRREPLGGRNSSQQLHNDNIWAIDTDPRRTVAERYDDTEPLGGHYFSPRPDGTRTRRDSVSQPPYEGSHLRQEAATEGVATARVGMRKGSVKGRTDRRPKHVSRPVTEAPDRRKRERTDEPTDNDSYSF